MQSHNQKKQQYVTATGRYHTSKGYPQYFHQNPPGLTHPSTLRSLPLPEASRPYGGGDVGGFSAGPGGGGGTSLRLSQFPAPHPPPAAAPQPPQGPPQLRQQQAPPHNATPNPQPHSQHHTHSHAPHPQHTQHHQVLQQGGGVGGHGTGGVGTGVGQVGVPPGPSPAPPGPPHDLNTPSLPPGSTSQTGGTLPVASAHNMMYTSTTQNQSQGPQPNAQGQFYPHPGGPSGPQHLPSGQPRQVTLPQHMPNFSVMPPNVMHFYPSAGSGNVQLAYISPAFQAMAHRPPSSHPQPGQYHPPQMPQSHPQHPYQGIPYPQAQGGKHEAPSTIQFRQPQGGVFYPPPPQQAPMKPAINQAPQRERKTLAIVDPNTGKNILDDMNNEKSDKTPTPPQSSESSARNTPAPSATPPTKTESAAIAAKFAEEVAKKAAEKDIDIETTDHVVRTNKQSDSSSSTVIISECRETKEKINNSIANKAESVSSNLVDSGIGKTVPEPVEVVKPQPKQQPPQDSQQIQLPQFTQQMPQIQQQHLTQTLPQTMQPSIQQLPQQPLQQMPQQSVQPPVQPMPQHPVHHIPQMPPQPMQQLQQPPSQQVLQPPPSQQVLQPPPPQLSQAPQQAPPKQKSPVPHQSQQSQQSGQQQPQPQQTMPPPQPIQPIQPVQPVQPPVQLPPQPAEVPSPPQPSPTQPPKPQSAQKLPDTKPEACIKPPAPAQPDVRETQAQAKPEPQLPPKQANAKPSVPTPSVKEKEAAPEPPQQSIQGKRGKAVPREETTPARDTVDDSTPQPPQQPLLPSEPQKAPTPPTAPQQASGKIEAPIQNAKEKEKEKEKTPEPEVPAVVQPPAPRKASPPPARPVPPPPAAKEATPQPEPSPTLPEEHKPDVPVEEEVVNSVEVDVNNVHEEKEEEKKDDGPQLKYVYKDDQWSPLNPDGKRQYDRRFLLELQNNPLSLKKPEKLPNLEVVRDGPGRPKAFDPRGSMAHVGGGPDFTPDYVKSSMGNKQPRMVGRNSQQRRDAVGPVNRGGGRGPNKVISIPLSTGREAKLKTTENAWKPSAKDKKIDDNAETDEVVKVMRGILNKLTPEKFEKLVDTVKTMPINTTERLSVVIDLIFEKAVDEQSFSSTYAQMCQVLSLMSVRGTGNDSGNSGKNEVKFRNLIINKCQKEFEKDNTEEFRAERQKEIDATPDPEKKIELNAKLDYDETKLRKRSVGNIRFIGELYKLRMLTSPIMMRIIGTLLDRGDEESLECLCKLLTTIGKILENHCSQQQKAMNDLDKYFKIMDKLVMDRRTLSRVRFLMMDVIDLRQNHWIPRREDAKPKTKAQVQEEVKREEIEQQIALASNTGRRDDRDRDRGDRRRGGRDNRPSQLSDDGWNTVANTKGRTSFDSSRLKNTFSRPGGAGAAGDNKEVTLRGTGFSSWARGSVGGGLKDLDEGKQESNRFNVLMDNSMGSSALPADNRRAVNTMGGPRLAPGGGPARQGGFGSKSMPPPSNDKESALSAVKKLVASDRSKSTSRPESRDNSVQRESEAVRGLPPIDVDTAEKLSVAIIDEYTHNCDPAEAKLCIREKFATSTFKYFVQFSLEWVIDRDNKKRKMVGQLYHDLLVENLLTIEQLLEGAQDVLAMTEEYEIDIPQVCDYLGEIFAPCMNDNAISVKRMLDVAYAAGSKQASVFACILSQAAMIMGPNKVADIWNSSGLSWYSIVSSSSDKVDEFLKKHDVEFTVDRSKSGSQSGWNPQKVEAEFLKLFKRASNDEMFGWIDANIGNDAKSSKFIRALVTALVESQATTSNDGSSIRVAEDFEGKMKKRLAVVLKYVDSNETLEMQCIYALQALSVKHQHPPGLLEKCFNAFYDSEVVSEEAFEEWAKSQDPEEQEGKGVCVNSVKNFMRWLKEAEVEEAETHA